MAEGNYEYHESNYDDLDAVTVDASVTADDDLNIGEVASEEKIASIVAGRDHTFVNMTSTSDSKEESGTCEPDTDAATGNYRFGDSTSGFETPFMNKDRFVQELPVSGIPDPMVDDKPQFNVDWNRDSYPAWGSNNNVEVPISVNEISSIFGILKRIFGFQRDSTRNMFDHFMILLDSRSSRMGPEMALVTLHADYIGGENANYKKWYFASQLDLDDLVGFDNVSMNGTLRKSRSDSSQAPKCGVNDTLCGEIDTSLKGSQIRWSAKMYKLTYEEMVTQIALYLLCWGEANQVRFMPECLDFIFKCCYDHYVYSTTIAVSSKSQACSLPEGYYLNNVITPLYNFYRDQIYERVGKTYTHREKDHKNIIGYDDMNQLFWYREGLLRLKVVSGKNLLDYPNYERFMHLYEVNWSAAFYKTYRETRSWMHMAVNFSRIWIIHTTIFWFYTAFNTPSLYTVGFQYTKNNQPPPQIRWTIVSLGGALAPIISIIATIGEFLFVPRHWPGAQGLSIRMLFMVITLCINVGPTIYILHFRSWVKTDTLATTIAICQTAFSLMVILYFSIIPLGSIVFGSYLYPRRSGGSERRYLASRYFTASIYELEGNDRLISYGLWICVFVAKLTESYFFLTLSIRDPIREISILGFQNCIGDMLIGPWLCKQQAIFVLIAMIITDLILFFLDTYLWYIIFNTLFSVTRSFYLGASIWTPWRNIYSRLPKRIYSKLLFTGDVTAKRRTKHLVAQVWNAVVLAMYREHLLPMEQAQKLAFHKDVSKSAGVGLLIEPTFFVSREDQSFHTSLVEVQSEAERRISFFAQSLATPIPEVLPIESMPAFTVLVPHYGEKIMLSLKQIICEHHNSKVTLLEYLKQLHPLEWDCFVRDTKGLVQEDEDFAGIQDNDQEGFDDQNSDLPFYCIGFKSSLPEYTLRTRMWASLRSQTLYRTISGFMNYPRAIKLLYTVEDLHEVAVKAESQPELKDLMETLLNNLANRKFRLIAAVQRLSEFNEEENSNKELLLRAYPDLKIVYLEEVKSQLPNVESTFYSCMIDGGCALDAEGKRTPRYRVKVSGDPILGDGKSDNQNHALIFYRGEYIQLVDANQDNYLEECIKIRSILSEFEENTVVQHPYKRKESVTDSKTNYYGSPAPVAILGSREYIFSENIGVLGDVAAGKEQTFGTLFSRTLAKIGGKLHYGHPDFLNGIFMTTRGGVSKAQKGLHLNEDIYAGINALIRGGRIKHSEYCQCGKGRDLGFGSILNFTTKIGAGMGEQILSREYFYLGTQLPLDRFLSFYYAHPGFHINNMFIVVSLELFLVVMLNIGALVNEADLCAYDRNAPRTDIHKPPGCQNLIPLVEWVERCVLSIFVVFFISFLPLFVQELTERGFFRSVTRLGKHFGSLSPLFEVFVCQIYAQSLVHDLSIGGARYISTGRGFATSRIPFTVLYSRFSTASIYFGARSLLVVLFVSKTIWKVSYLWFWVTTIALCFAPMIYNPHQFSAAEFFLDYRDFIRWLGRGTTKFHSSSWIAYVRDNRAKITGYKKKTFGEDSENNAKDILRPSFVNILVSKIFGSFVLANTAVIPYVYMNSQNDLRGLDPVNHAIIRLGILVFGPIVVNGIFLLMFFSFSCIFISTISRYKWGSRVAAMVAGVLHGFSVINYLVFFEILLMTEHWNFQRALVALIATVLVQSFVLDCITVLFLSREFKHDRVNRAWWSGNWIKADLKWRIFTHPFREFLCKVTEMSLFTMDFVLGHFLFFAQTPILLIPYVDRWHSMMLFWLRPSRQIRPAIYSFKHQKMRKRLVHKYATLYFIVLVLFLCAVIGPALIPTTFKEQAVEACGSYFPGLIQTRPRATKIGGGTGKRP